MTFAWTCNKNPLVSFTFINVTDKQGALPALTVSRDVDDEDNEEEMEFLAEVGNSITKEEILELLERIPELDYSTAMVCKYGISSFYDTS